MWRYVKFPLVVALLAFVLPWMSVSFLNDKVIEASGWELLNGRPRSQFGDVAIKLGDTTINYYLAAGAALIAAGLILSFFGRRMAITVVVFSLLAMALVWAGAAQYSEARIGSIASDKAGIVGAIVAPGLQVDWYVGYWVAMVALGVTAALSFLAIREPAS